jgi:hypothetical protein
MFDDKTNKEADRNQMLADSEKVMEMALDLGRQRYPGRRNERVCYAIGMLLAAAFKTATDYEHFDHLIHFTRTSVKRMRQLRELSWWRWL